MRRDYVRVSPGSGRRDRAAPHRPINPRGTVRELRGNNTFGCTHFWTSFSAGQNLTPMEGNVKHRCKFMLRPCTRARRRMTQASWRRLKLPHRARSLG